jgi:hypothetical protein
MVKCDVLFEVRTELLNAIYTSFALFLPEGRAGVAWEPSNKIMLFIFLSSSMIPVQSRSGPQPKRSHLSGFNSQTSSQPKFFS